MKGFKLYTDGSHFKGGNVDGRLGIGAVLVSSGGSVVDSLSMAVDRILFAERYRTGDVSNPTMEMYAVLVALKRFNRHLSFGDEVEIYSDYQGVTYWMYHKWKINKDYIQMLCDDITKEIKDQRLNVTFKWIKGHDGDRYNELTDKLAKGEITKV
jgi:ribonuclease HI